MPIPRAALMSRQAISPRLAIRIFLNMAASGRVDDVSSSPDRELSERNIAVLAPGVLQLLVPEHGERPADAFAGLVGHDHIVDEPAVAGDERVGKLLLVFFLPGGDPRRVSLLVTKDDLHGALGA